MCGIAGIMAFTTAGESCLTRIEACNNALKHRGPDFQRCLLLPKISLAHSRLSIIDTSTESNQPFADDKEEYFLVFNGEIFNYQVIRKELSQKGTRFRTQGDAEVLLELFKSEGVEGLNKISGFFAAGIYHKTSNTLTLIRDRFGVKPLYYYQNNDNFIFASETRAIKECSVPLSISKESLYFYFQMNYIPGNNSIFYEVKKVPPGHFVTISGGQFSTGIYYTPQKNNITLAKNTTAVESNLRDLLQKSVQDRLVADIPVGCFLSGGLDSSIVTALAARERKNIPTFSLGYSNNTWFDESKDAEFTAKKLGTDHHTFLLSQNDLSDEFENFLNALDEPFADSSALNVFILCKKTKKHVKAVLSGDGADEVFGGYNKHRAEWMIRNHLPTKVLGYTGKIFSKLISGSRNSLIGNRLRQWKKLSALIHESPAERYWKMACLADSVNLHSLFRKDFFLENYSESKNKYLDPIRADQSLNGFLRNDVSLVLESDMLVKTDRMSMANGLEIRSPFIDYRVIEWGLKIPDQLKINRSEGKRILKSAFRNILPQEVLQRKKRGFEIPLQKWLVEELKNREQEKLLQSDFITEQGIFNPKSVSQLRSNALSNNPGDSTAQLWAILIFNYWFQKNQLNFS